MKYKLLEKDIIEHQAGRTLAVITANSAKGVYLTAEEISISLEMSKDMTRAVLAKLIAENKIEEASGFPGLVTPA